MSFNHETTNDIFIDVKEEKEIDKTNTRIYINDYLNNIDARLEELKKTDKKQERNELIGFFCINQTFLAGKLQ